MKAAAIFGDRKGGVIDVPDPKPKDNWVLVKIHAAPMCTEYKGFTGGRKTTSLGHEAAGEVVEIAQPGRVSVGDRVAVMPQYPCGVCPLCVSGDYIHCQQSANFAEFTGGNEGRATMAQYLLKPDWLLPKIPDDVSYEHGGMACCGLGPTFGAIQRMQINAYDTFMVTGLGPVGLGGVINSKHLGARVIAIDINPYRREKSPRTGRRRSNRSPRRKRPATNNGPHQRHWRRCRRRLLGCRIRTPVVHRHRATARTGGIRRRMRRRNPLANQPGHDPKRHHTRRLMALQLKRRTKTHASRPCKHRQIEPDDLTYILTRRRAKSLGIANHRRVCKSRIETVGMKCEV